MRKRTIVKLSILSTTLLLNTGCFFGYFGGQIMVPKEKPQTALAASAPIAECSDDVNAVSSCNKAPISPTELKPKQQTATGGEVHNLKSIQGQPITILERSNGFIFPQYANKIIILEMFGKSCPHCIHEIPTLNKIRSKYRKDVEVIAVQVEDQMSPLEAKSLINKHKIHYPIISGDTATNLQYSIQNTYGWSGILPYTMIIKNGVTEFIYRGTATYEEFDSDIQSLIE